jgi:hypothetical protein
MSRIKSCNMKHDSELKIYDSLEVKTKQTSGFGTIGVEFLYFEALNRHAIALSLVLRSFSSLKHKQKSSDEF